MLLNLKLFTPNLDQFRSNENAIFGLACSVINNKINNLRGLLLEILAWLSSISDDEKDLKMIKFSLSPIKLRFDPIDLSPIDDPIFDVESQSAVLVHTTLRANSRARIEIFIRLLKEFYNARSVDALMVVMGTLSHLLEEDPEIFGLCMKQEEDVSEMVEVLATGINMSWFVLQKFLIAYPYLDSSHYFGLNNIGIPVLMSRCFRRTSGFDWK